MSEGVKQENFIDSYTMLTGSVLGMGGEGVNSEYYEQVLEISAAHLKGTVQPKLKFFPLITQPNVDGSSGDIFWST